jgi:hypothetical protein
MIGENCGPRIETNGSRLMWTGVRRTAAIIFVATAVCGLASAGWATPETGPRKPAAKPKDAKPKDAKPAPARPAQARPAEAHGHGPKFRPARGAAAADAKRIGALVGKECTGRADMQRNEHQWVVLCSNGKTYVVEPAAPHPAASPPIECSLAGTGPEPACFP